MNRCRIGDKDAAAGGEENSQCDHPPDAVSLLPAAYQKHEDSDRCEHGKDDRPSICAANEKHLLPYRGHHTGKAEGESARPEDGDAAADYGQNSIPVLRILIYALVQVYSSWRIEFCLLADRGQALKNYPVIPKSIFATLLL